ncbi:uncharacterized protein LOC116249222 isoform X1 [Nymphaea colorata]|nr:uncharacterized protein LOC116249222 isoform X1 [Nymphaea colorata]XP_049932120.1 uncharacterized protein LOC116249222 isoform X1 [Nymphaea colorata]XP_049932121.1 uncharacterized protein LOC116249222 isoform X1 [Nymphaea colorata]XP_049932122.1 uncharacterized protein LOC116249222 isoform X1 [Nymphaea colorata]XP_049932123.1 uncharacterized protein LOC116249222 isoform X1 [Nymphaea colorata]
MKIKEKKSGILTNFEVLEHLKSRGATLDPFGSLSMARRSECKVFDYLAQTSAATQTRERISEFLQRSEKYKLTSAEKVQVINLSPSRPVELDGVMIVPEVENRMTDDEVNEFLNLVVELLPPCPSKSGSEDTMEEVQEAQ